jgi:hypothetical protein
MTRRGADRAMAETVSGRVTTGAVGGRRTGRGDAGRAMPGTVRGRRTPETGAGHSGPDPAATIEAGRAVTTHGAAVTGVIGIDERTGLTRAGGFSAVAPVTVSGPGPCARAGSRQWRR